MNAAPKASNPAHPKKSFNPPKTPFSARKRRSPRWLFITAALMVLGGGLYRFNVYLIGFNPGQGWHYFPAFPELMITVGVIALEILGYQVLVKVFPVLPNAHKHGAGTHAAPHDLPGSVFAGK